MHIRKVTAAALLAASAGLASAQPATVDGVKDGAEPYVLLWAQNQPTAFGDAIAGQFTGGDFGDPPGDVTTGVEVQIELVELGLVGTETISIGGWVNSGDRTFKSNQIIGSLPVDTNHLGGAGTDFTAIAGDQHVVVNLSSAPTFSGTVDGARDASYGSAVFLQGNYTSFGNETDGTTDGAGPNGGGSEIDALYVAKTATHLHIFVAGNLEFNGNALDLYLDTAAGGSNALAGGSGSGDFIVNAQGGTTFDAAMTPEYVISVDSWDHDADTNTVNVPRCYAGPIAGDIDDAGSIGGYGAGNAGACTGGDAGAAAVTLGVDNSNIAGVIGSPSQASPVSPDDNWAYGSEFDNVWAYLDDEDSDTVADHLYILVGGNTEISGNKMNFFLDVDGSTEGQNPLRTDNPDISFNGLNRMGDLIWDAGFVPDYWFNVNTNVDGGSGNLQNFTDAAVLRTDGPLFDLFSGSILDYGAFFGGALEDGVGTPVAMPLELMDFSGPQIDIQDGTFASLFTQYAPRTAQLDPNNPVAGLLQTAINNSNTAGVTDSNATGACEVCTGIEICIDLNEAGWDQSSDILLAGFVNAGGFDFVSNQVIGGLPDDGPGVPASNLGDPAFVDFSTIAGDQFINITALLNSGGITCDAGGCTFADCDANDALNVDDIDCFVTAFLGGDLDHADCDGNGVLNVDDIDCFVTSFLGGCL
ncbi:MAG: hypothetical protein DHS20C14_18630 [Phycisphaeraceae bacterium]|nr:MAG: hypothetical protein DHS20C14_18630 [Phycisphaeraceae bacterium]